MNFGILIIAGLLCSLSTVVSAQTGCVNSSPNANFSSCHTYVWGQNQNPNQISNSFPAQEAGPDGHSVRWHQLCATNGSERERQTACGDNHEFKLPETRQVLAARNAGKALPTIQTGQK
jgi:hypothetical protein